MHLQRSCSEDTIINDAEAQPLLGGASDDPGDPSLKLSPPTPLPKVQLAALCALRLVEPVAFTHIFPYVNEMLAGIGVASDPAKVGFYSGLVVSPSNIILFSPRRSHPILYRRVSSPLPSCARYTSGPSSLVSLVRSDNAWGTS